EARTAHRDPHSLPTRRSSDLSARVGDAIVGALVVVNAVGDVREPETGALIAGTRDAPTGRRLIDTARALREGGGALGRFGGPERSEEHTSELQSRGHLVCRLL